MCWHVAPQTSTLLSASWVVRMELGRSCKKAKFSICRSQGRTQEACKSGRGEKVSSIFRPTSACPPKNIFKSSWKLCGYKIKWKPVPTGITPHGHTGSYMSNPSAERAAVQQGAQRCWCCRRRPQPVPQRRSWAAGHSNTTQSGKMWSIQAAFPRTL